MSKHPQIENQEFPSDDFNQDSQNEQQSQDEQFDEFNQDVPDDFSQDVGGEYSQDSGYDDSVQYEVPEVVRREPSSGKKKRK